MKKRLLAFALACVMLLGAGAYAEEIEERIEHLKSHGKKEVFYCSGRLVKLRVAPGANKMNGRAVKGEQLAILDTFGEWVHVEIVEKMPDNEDARRGMTGWIHEDNIECSCDIVKAELWRMMEEQAAAQEQK